MTKKLSPETSLSFYLLSKNKEYLETINFRSFDWEKFLRRSSLNRCIYFLINEAQKDKSIIIPERIINLMDDILKVAELYLEKLEKTLKIVKESLEENKIEYLLVKTERILRFVTIDVDLFVDAKDVPRVKRLFKEKANAKVTPFLPKNQTDILIEGLLMIDLHENFFWFRQEYFDNELVWKSPRQIKLEGYTLPAPSISIDLLLTIAHILYERLQITLLEFNYIREKSSEVDWNFIFSEAKKYKWDGNLNYFCNLMNTLNKEIYKEEKDLIPIVKKRKIRLRKTLDMPYVFPFWQTVMVFVRNLFRRRHLKLYDVFYHVYANLRYERSKGERVPMFWHWYNFE